MASCDLAVGEAQHLEAAQHQVAVASPVGLDRDARERWYLQPSTSTIRPCSRQRKSTVYGPTRTLTSGFGMPWRRVVSSGLRVAER